MHHTIHFSIVDVSFPFTECSIFQSSCTRPRPCVPSSSNVGLYLCWTLNQPFLLLLFSHPSRSKCHLLPLKSFLHLRLQVGWWAVTESVADLQISMIIIIITIITITITIVIIAIITIITIIMPTEDLDRNLLLPHRHSNQNNENLPLARITTIKITKIIPAPLLVSSPLDDLCIVIFFFFFA